jgi:uncharacterized membrane protein YeaQ/YmgE (transglycosylase-associated protein family)
LRHVARGPDGETLRNIENGKAVVAVAAPAGQETERAWGRLPRPFLNRKRARGDAGSCGDSSMSIIITIIIGFLAGLIAKFLMPGRDPGGFIITTLLGIVGAVIATYLGQAVGWYRAGEGAGFIGAVVGAVILLAIYRMVAGRSTRA